MRFETSLLDKILNKALFGKRQLGRPLKHNLPNKDTRGVLELMYKPRNRLEAFLGRCVHGSLPVLSYYTYRFHVERSRAARIRLEDQYFHRFFREPYAHLHVYAQNFHPGPWTSESETCTSTERPRPCSRDSRFQTGPSRSAKKTASTSTCTRDRTGKTQWETSTPSGLRLRSKATESIQTLSTGSDSSRSARDSRADCSSTKCRSRRCTDTAVTSTTKKRRCTRSSTPTSSTKTSSASTWPPSKADKAFTPKSREWRRWPQKCTKLQAPLTPSTSSSTRST